MSIFCKNYTQSGAKCPTLLSSPDCLELGNCEWGLAKTTTSGQCTGLTCVLTDRQLTSDWKLWTIEDKMDKIDTDIIAGLASDPTMIAILALVVLLVVVVVAALIFYCVKRGCMADLEVFFNGLCLRFRTICGAPKAEQANTANDLIELA